MLSAFLYVLVGAVLEHRTRRDLLDPNRVRWASPLINESNYGPTGAALRRGVRAFWAVGFVVLVILYW